MAENNKIVPLDERKKAIRSAMNAQKGEIAKALSGALDVDKFIRVALTAISTGDDSLLLADPVSLLGAITQAAQLGLSIDPFVGEAYLVARKNKDTGGYWASLMLGYQGLMKRARKSGEIDFFDGGAVYEGDKFKVIRDADGIPMVEHERGLEAKEEPRVIASWAIAHFANSRHRRLVVLPRWEIDKSKKMAGGGGKYGPWKDHLGPMAIKTALRKLCKLLPMDEMTTTTLALEDANDRGEGHLGFGATIDAEFGPEEDDAPVNAMTALKARVRKETGNE